MNLTSYSVAPHLSTPNRHTGAWSAELPPSADASQLREPPATARGVCTRAKLIVAARAVFERDGYVAVRLADIAAAAGTSVGTLYLYFDGKEQLLHAVLEQAQNDMLHPGFERVADATPQEVIDASNRAYLRAYKRNAKLMPVLAQVAAVDPDFRALRQRRTRAFVERNARSIADLQRCGLVDPEIDPMQAAAALSAMVARTAGDQFCYAESESQVEVPVGTLRRLWTNAVKPKVVTGDD